MPSGQRPVLQLLPEVVRGFQLESTWAFIGQGYLDLDQAAAAVTSATLVREVVVEVEDLADLGLWVQAGRVAAEPPSGSSDLSEGH